MFKASDSAVSSTVISSAVEDVMWYRRERESNESYIKPLLSRSNF